MVHGPHRMCPNDFGELHTFALGPPANLFDSVKYLDDYSVDSNKFYTNALVRLWMYHPDLPCDTQLHK